MVDDELVKKVVNAIMKGLPSNIPPVILVADGGSSMGEDVTSMLYEKINPEAESGVVVSDVRAVLSSDYDPRDPSSQSLPAYSVDVPGIIQKCGLSLR